jgi:Ca2+/Na+ antiporter
LALTIIAWGNCLGDLAADVAMTKKGFGEMAITGCIAGPIFNVLIGIGLSNLIGIMNEKDISSAKVEFSLYYTNELGELAFSKLSVLPLTLLTGQLVVLIMILVNGISNNYHISYNQCKISLIFYFITVIGLVVYSIAEDV